MISSSFCSSVKVFACLSASAKSLHQNIMPQRLPVGRFLIVTSYLCSIVPPFISFDVFRKNLPQFLAVDFIGFPNQTQKMGRKPISITCDDIADMFLVMFTQHFALAPPNPESVRDLPLISRLVRQPL